MQKLTPSRAVELINFDQILTIEGTKELHMSDLSFSLNALLILIAIIIIKKIIKIIKKVKNNLFRINRIYFIKKLNK